MLSPSQYIDINDALDAITLTCFEEYSKAEEDTKEKAKPTIFVKKYEHPYKSKKKKDKKR